MLDRASHCSKASTAVFEFGVDPTSPAANTLGKRTCCSVFLSTSTKPAASARAEELTQTGALMGGLT